MGERRTVAWQAVDLRTGEVADISISPSIGQSQRREVWHGYETPTTASDAHRIAAHGALIDRGGDRLRYGGATEGMRRQLLLRGRGQAQSAEDRPPIGWAAYWFTSVLMQLGLTNNGRSKCVPPSGVAVAQQLARLAGDGRQVTIPQRSLADAVGRADSAGRVVAYTQRGVQALIEYGLIERTVTGKGRAGKTTYRLVAPWLGSEDEAGDD